MASEALPRLFFCDAHGRKHDVRSEDCTRGEHCTSTGAECNAAWNVEDHARRCCICATPIPLKNEQKFTLVHGCWDCPWGCPECTGDTSTCECYTHEHYVPVDPPKPREALARLELLLRWPLYINDDGRLTCNAGCDDWDLSAAGRRCTGQDAINLLIEHIIVDHSGQLP